MEQESSGLQALVGPYSCYQVHGISQARILEWVAISFSRGASQPRDQTHVLLHWQADSLLLSHQRSPGQGILGVANQFPCPELSSQALSNDHSGSFPTMFCLHLKAPWPLVHMLVAQLCPILCELGLWPARLCPWHSLGKNTRVGCHNLLAGNRT